MPVWKMNQLDMQIALRAIAASDFENAGFETFFAIFGRGS